MLDTYNDRYRPRSSAWRDVPAAIFLAFRSTSCNKETTACRAFGDDDDRVRYLPLLHDALHAWPVTRLLELSASALWLWPCFRCVEVPN